MKNGFEIPLHMKNDLVYCRRAISNHILIHQKLIESTSDGQIQPQEMRKSLIDIEKVILDIGGEQKLLFNRLRFSMDYHLLTRSADINERIGLTNLIRDEIVDYDRSHDDDIQPKEVQSRLDLDRLYAKYMLRNEIDSDEAMDVDQPTIDAVKSQPSTSRSCAEPSKRSSVSDKVKPMVKIMQKNVQNKDCVKSGQSLLKPRPQWNQPKNGPTPLAQPSTTTRAVECENPTATIQLSRLKLQEALSKAKGATAAAPASGQNSTRQSPDLESPVPSPKMPSSQSSNSSSEEADSIDKNNAMNTTTTVDELSQEEFLRIFRLYTHDYSDYLKNRKPIKRRRNCTTMSARADFHYGKYELFERQYANKRNKRQFLYSPPATRAKKRLVSNVDKLRLAVTTAAAAAAVAAATTKNTVVGIKPRNGLKSSASSSSSLESNSTNRSARITVTATATATAAKDNKVCLKCYKRNNLYACIRCDGRYHSYCHMADVEINVRRTVCPDCCRPKLNVDQSKRTYITAGK